ncbi:MAG: D-sedoheptulose 7-phosphate isomerase [Candidatus Kapaibacteriales bacterium]
MTNEFLTYWDETLQSHLRSSIETKKKLLQDNSSRRTVIKIGSLLAEKVKTGGKILLCGNGGSAADAQHLAAELVIRLRSEYERPGIPAMALTVDPSIMTAGGNDIGYENIFARCVQAYGNSNDVLIGISTSGNSENVLRAIKEAKSKGIASVGLLGKDGGKILPECDMVYVVDSEVTAHIQEVHITVGHVLCQMIEEIVYPKD